MVLQDLRYAFRMLRRSPGFTATAVLTLALGIGANTAVFSVINGVLLRPLPYAEPDRLAMLWTDDPRHGLHEEGTSYPNFEDWKSQSRAFADMSAAADYTVSLTGAGEPERVRAAAVSANLFALLGRQPILGRDFDAGDVERRERVVVLSYGLWQRRFGGAPDVTGKTVEIDGKSAQIVGVMPRDFFFPGKEAQLWEPVTSFSRWDKVRAKRYSDWWLVVGRLKPGTTFDGARAEMNAVGSRLEQSYAAGAEPDFAGFGVNVVPLANQIFSTRLRQALWSLLGAVLFVLLIACANLANLMLARGAARGREFAIRAALGARRPRLVLQLLTENAVLALAAGLLGLALAAFGVRALVAFAPRDVPRLEDVGIDFRVLLFTFCLSLLASVLFGLLPAWRVARTDPNDSLKEGGRGVSGRVASRTRGLLVAAEVALAVVLLAGAGLLIRSFLRVQAVEPGFDPARLLTLKVNLPASSSNAQTSQFYRQAFERVATLPGVESVGAARHIFLETHPDVPVYVEGHAPPSPGQGRDELTSDEVSAGYFKTMRIPLLKGRFFNDEDGAESPRVAVINETMARRFFPGEDPLGKRFKYGGVDSRSPFMTVVGVVGDVRQRGPDRPPLAQYFVPLTQEPAPDASMVVRTAAADPLSLAAAVRSELHAVDKNVTLSAATTVERRLEGLNSQRSFQTWLLALFSAAALALASIGVYGVISYAVTQRTHELGVRIALGARRADILRLVVRQGMAFVLVGLAAGALLALWLTPALASLLYGVSENDPLTFAGVALLLICAALPACYLPARRAAGIDPLVALRRE
ncbi:MAG TPA: ABC transporter permease [Pyrinomonadaceae bacterium]|jgi:putative ABC transport system permease protein|nr:ABC transporter permease [Pyrinomonadaceae bacterium]